MNTDIESRMIDNETKMGRNTSLFYISCSFGQIFGYFNKPYKEVKMIKKPWCIMAFIFIAIPLFSQQLVDLEEVLRFSDVPEKEIYFKNPQAIKLDDDGNIYIQDKPHILKFGPDGKFLVKMIKEGQGPRELPDGYVGSLTDFIIVKNKVIAFSSYKALWFNEKGEFQEEKRLPTKGANFIVTPDLNYYAFERIRPRRDVLHPAQYRLY